MIYVRQPYAYDTNQVSDETGLKCLDKSRTQQQFAEESDINTIVNRFLKTGQLPDNVRVPQYGDFTEVMDFQTAMNAVREAQESFDRLPGQMRARFHNDPQELLEFVSDADNYDEALKLGLVQPRPEPAPVPEAPAPVPPTGGPATGGTT